MKTQKYCGSMVAILAATMVIAVQGAEDRTTEAQEAIQQFQKRDSSIKEMFETAAGYAVFPSVAKGGLVVGGAHGDGLVYEKGGKVIGKASISQASVGAQIGGQSFSEVIFFETPAALETFKTGSYEMKADVSAVAAAEGAAKSAKYTQGVAVFTLPKKGLMAEASIGGQKFKFQPMAAGTPGKSTDVEKGTQ